MKKIYNKKFKESILEIFHFLKFVKAASWSFKSLYTLEYFAWKIQNNPFGESFCYLRYVENEAVAHSSITSKPINTNLNLGSSCGELGDTHTHPDFQKQGHFGEVGSQVIKDFNDYNNNECVIFGIPNENAVRGWQTRCNCELIENLNLGEYLSKRLHYNPFNFVFGLVELQKESDLMINIDSVWRKSYKNKTCLIKKDSFWFNWRYLKSTENFKFFSIKTKNENFSAVLVVKFSSKGIFSNIDICDVLGVDLDSELELLDSFLKKYSSPLNKIRIWAKKETELERLLIKHKFTLSKKIYFVLYKNKSYDSLMNQGIFFDLSLGDTDNV